MEVYMYKWGYLTEVTLSKLELTQDEAVELKFTNKFPFYANEAMTQICSAVKPKRTFYEFQVYNTCEVVDNGCIVDGKLLSNVSLDAYDRVVNVDGKVLYYPNGRLITMPSDFISFGDDVCTITCNFDVEECHDDILEYKGYNQIICRRAGLYHVSYNARWYTFSSIMNEEEDLSFIPRDILDCIPSYIVSQCYKIDDEYKSSIYRNEYEMFLARIDDVNFKNTKTFTIGGDW